MATKVISFALYAIIFHQAAEKDKKKPVTGTVKFMKLDALPQVPEVLSGTGTQCD
jgi:hypothetical protein